MNYPVLYKPPAKQDLAEAFQWYEAERAGLGREFVAAVQVLDFHISRFPRAFPAVRGCFRRALLNRFPYALYYAVEKDQVVVFAVLHAHRSPRVWRSRLKKP